MSHSRTAERRFYLAFVLLIFGAVLLGFGRSFFLRAWFPEWVDLHAPVPGYANFDLVALAFLLPLVAWDLTTPKRIHPATLYGGLALIALVPITGFVSRTGWWYAFGDWVVAG